MQVPGCRLGMVDTPLRTSAQRPLGTEMVTEACLALGAGKSEAASPAQGLLG